MTQAVRVGAEHRLRAALGLSAQPRAPPTPGPQPTDQDRFTNPNSRIMKSSTHAGCEENDSGQVADDQASRLIVGHTLSDHPTDHGEAVPTLVAISADWGAPPDVDLDTGSFSAANVAALAERGVTLHIATGREPHYQSWQAYVAAEPVPPPSSACNPINRLRRCIVEPVIGIIMEALGFRQFSVRGLSAVAGEWGLVCLAYTLRCLHVLGLAKTVPADRETP